MRPLILDYKISRIDNGEKTMYDYDVQRSLNMITVDGVRQPFINTNNSNVELETKTKVHREQDDDHFRLEVVAKTFTSKSDNKRYAQLEMETKTLVTRERDDESFDYYQ